MDKWIKAFTRESAAFPVIAIISGLLFGALIMLIGGYDPLLAYGSLFMKVFGDSYGFGETIREITPLLLTGLSVAFAFRTGLFNIGAEGQFIMGGLGAVIVGVKLSLPWFIHAPLAIVAGALLAGLWGGLVGLLKARWGVNEVITSIMLNWVSLYLANYVISRFLLQPGQQRTYMIHDSASISFPWLSHLFHDARLHWGILIALIAVPVFYIILWKTRQGFELRAVGLNPQAAQYAGMNVNRNIIKAMFIGGVFAGLAGVFEVLGVFHYAVIAASSPGYGFDGIAVSLLGGNHPVGILLSAVLFGSLTYGAAGMSFGAGVPPEIIRIVIGSVMFFIASPGIIRWVMRSIANKRKKGEVV
jgi:general nucleoside transport system permease protein